MIIQKHFFHKLLVIFLVMFVSGCTLYIHFTISKYLDEMKDKHSILVFGYFDDTDAPYDMEYGEIKQFRPEYD